MKTTSKAKATVNCPIPDCRHELTFTAHPDKPGRLVAYCHNHGLEPRAVVEIDDPAAIIAPQAEPAPLEV